MSTNLDRFKKDLAKLIEQGDALESAMLLAINKDGFSKQVKSIFKDKSEDFLKNLPNFNEEYEAWYSESLALIKQILNDRMYNFISYYEKPKSRKSINHENYTIQDYLLGVSLRNYLNEVIVNQSAALPKFRQQRSILKAAQARFESSLFDIQQIVQADLFDSELDKARELNKHKFVRAAGAITGVVLEKHLRLVCDNHSIKILKKNPGIGDLNELLKTNSVIDVTKWRFISMLADIRNICDHNKHIEPSFEQVDDLINGTEKTIKSVF